MDGGDVHVNEFMNQLICGHNSMSFELPPEDDGSQYLNTTGEGDDGSQYLNTTGEGDESHDEDEEGNDVPEVYIGET
ncbi:unnamed protein product [Urochloa humidicola]